MNQKVFTSEAVGHGHPDIIADTISDSVLDRCLDLNPDARVAIETLVVGNHVIVAGEIANVELTIKDIDDVIHEVVNLNDSPGIKLFKSKNLVITQEVRQQSVEIARGVVENLGAGDQGCMFGFSCTDNEDMLPMPLFLSRRLANFLCSHKTHPNQFANPVTEIETIADNIFKDCKTQFTLEYDDKTKKFGKVKHVVCSIHHDETHDITTLRSYLTGTIIALVSQLYPESGIENAKFHINPTGSFLSGGPDADTGLTGRKLIAGTYGGFAHHGGGALCIAKNSLVNTSHGSIPLSECSQYLGHLVKTDVHPEPMGQFWNNGVKDTLLLKTDAGYELEATPDHLIRVIDSSGVYVWKQMQEVSDDDAIAIQRKNRLFGDEVLHDFNFVHKKGTAHKLNISIPTVVTKEVCELMGWWTGDGNGTGNYISIAFDDNDTKLGKHIASLMKQCFGIEGSQYGHRIQLNSLEARAFLAYLGCDYKRAWDKQVPSFIWKTTRENVAAYLRGCFETDGCVTIRKNRVKFQYTSTSSLLIKQIQQLLLNFGIATTISESQIPSKSSFIKGREVQSRRIAYVLTLRGEQSFRIFADEIGFSYGRKRDILRNSKYFITSGHYDGIPNLLPRLKELYSTLPAEVRKATTDFGRIFREASDEKKRTKTISYTKLKFFIEHFKEYLVDNPLFTEVEMLLMMNHYWVSVKERIKSFAEVCDINVPESHTFTANGFVVHNSGKDVSKVDRSAALYVRWLANRIVKQEKLADLVELQVGYAIGEAQPMSVSIIQLDKPENEAAIEEFLMAQDFTPQGMIGQLRLKEERYQSAAMFGHFGKQPNGHVYNWETV